MFSSFCLWNAFMVTSFLIFLISLLCYFKLCYFLFNAYSLYLRIKLPKTIWTLACLQQWHCYISIYLMSDSCTLLQIAFAILFSNVLISLSSKDDINLPLVLTDFHKIYWEKKCSSFYLFGFFYLIGKFVYGFLYYRGQTRVQFLPPLFHQFLENWKVNEIKRVDRVAFCNFRAQKKVTPLPLSLRLDLCKKNWNYWHCN